MASHKTKIWMEVTQDKYEFPIHIADTSRELSRMCGVRADLIEMFAKENRNKNIRRRFAVVEIPDDNM